MTYNVFVGTLNLAQSINQAENCSRCVFLKIVWAIFEILFENTASSHGLAADADIAFCCDVLCCVCCAAVRWSKIRRLETPCSTLSLSLKRCVSVDHKS